MNDTKHTDSKIISSQTTNSQTTNSASTVSLEKPTLSDWGSAYDYQRRDEEIVDYHIWKLWTPQAGFALRGPRPTSIKHKDFCTSVGAAFTFGRFTQRPYPDLLGAALHTSSLNLGFAGIGPAFFNYPKNSVLIDIINRSKFVTISVFSGRSQSNSRFQSEEYSQVRYRLSDGRVVPADVAYQQLLDESDETTIRALVAETRERYLAEFVQFLEKITVPKVLLWFSKRSPDYTESYDSLLNLFGSFPHLVNQPMVDELRSHCDAYVECVSTVGLPQQLISRHTKQPTSISRPRTYKNGRVDFVPSQLEKNGYYPSPEMHYAVTQKLIPVCQQFLL